MISWSLHFPRMRNRESSKDGERKNILLTLSPLLFCLLALLNRGSKYILHLIFEFPDILG